MTLPSNKDAVGSPSAVPILPESNTLPPVCMQLILSTDMPCIQLIHVSRCPDLLLSPGWSCVHWAVYNGNPILTQALVRAGACSSYKKAPATLSQVGDD